MMSDTMPDLFGGSSSGGVSRHEEGARRSEASPSRRAAGTQPLADRLRPQSLDEVQGQVHLLGPEGTLSRML